MKIKEKLVEITDYQLKFNQDKNIFYHQDEPVIRFSPLTKKALGEIADELLSLDKGKNYDEIIEFTVQQVLKTLWHTNQYISIPEASINKLKEIYYNFWKELLLVLKGSKTYEEIEQLHNQRLREWLEKSNPFLKEVNPSSRANIKPVVNAEYTPDLQMELLDLKMKDIREPLLDIGCGNNAFLVKYLRKQGIEAFGLDRDIPGTDKYLIKDNWLNFNYRPAFWGTIVSHMAFSNHFVHHHYRKHGNYTRYGQVYMNILNSLQKSGNFHYAPGVPMIEMHLPVKQYQIHTRMIHDTYANAVVYKDF